MFLWRRWGSTDHGSCHARSGALWSLQTVIRPGSGQCEPANPLGRETLDRRKYRLRGFQLGKVSDFCQFMAAGIGQ